MKVGIIFYSQTGNTHSVANKLMERLVKAGHTVEIERLKPEGEVNPGIKDVEFKKMPDIKDYDLIIFGSPVWAFSLCTVSKIYLKKLFSLKDKKVVCFVTMAFPFAWMGGNNAISQMKKFFKSKGAMPQVTNVINWSRKRDEKIDKLINDTIQILK